MTRSTPCRARITTTLLGCALLAAAGCRAEAVRLYDDPAEPASRVARFEWWGGKAPRVRVAEVDGTPVAAKYLAAEARPGRRALAVEATWSNGWRDTTPLLVDAEAGRVYAVRVRESKSWLAVAADDMAESMGRTAAGALLLPGMVLHELNRKTPTGRPPRPCHVWVTDRKTGRTVAGVAPE
jgi:hypothetical protein